MRSSTSIEEIEIFYLFKEATQKKVELPKNKYELSNHLGNVLVTTSDLRKGTDNNADGIADYYNAIVTSANDYYAFGSLIGGRQYNSTSYRFGFNGQIKDDEIYGSGNALSFEYRVHDARLGRFLSVDPLTKDYPWNSTYAFAENRVIDGIDLEGAERFWSADGKFLGKYGNSNEIRVVTIHSDDIKKSLSKIQAIVLKNQTKIFQYFMKNSVKAYEKTKENELFLLRSWAIKNQNNGKERAMSLFTKVVESDVNTGMGPQIKELIIEGSTVEEKDEVEAPGASVNIDNSVSIKGWERFTSIHTHPSGFANQFSNEKPNDLLSPYGGDMGWAYAHMVTLYLVPPAGNTMGKFDPKFYLELINNEISELNKKYPTANFKLDNGKLKKSELAFDGIPSSNKYIAQEAIKYEFIKE